MRDDGRCVNLPLHLSTWRTDVSGAGGRTFIWDIGNPTMFVFPFGVNAHLAFCFIQAGVDFYQVHTPVADRYLYHGGGGLLHKCGWGSDTQPPCVLGSRRLARVRSQIKTNLKVRDKYPKPSGFSWKKMTWKK